MSAAGQVGPGLLLRRAREATSAAAGYSLAGVSLRELEIITAIAGEIAASASALLERAESVAATRRVGRTAGRPGGGEAA